MTYIPRHALDNLAKYSYKSVDKSILSHYVLNPFWTWFVTLWPLSVAPNTITLTGLCLVVSNVATMLYYDPAYLTQRGGVELPSWIYMSWAVGLFFYQALDAIDGKQARRTGMAGPLGELFDHGCDALNTTFEVILASHALNLGRSWWTVASQIATLANFYLTTWEEYHTGQLYLSAFSGPVEGIILIVLVYVITALNGPAFWDTPLVQFVYLDRLAPGLVAQLPTYLQGFGTNEAFMAFGAAGVVFNSASSWRNLRVATHAKNKSSFRPVLLLIPFVFSATIQVLWLSHPEWTHSAIIDSTLLVPFLLAWGLQFAHMVGRIILAHVTSTPFPIVDWMWIWSLIGAVDANVPRYFGRAPIIQSSSTNTAIFVYATLVLSFLAYGRFVTLVIQDITEYLGIACFQVVKKDRDGKWKDAKVVNEKEKAK